MAQSGSYKQYTRGIRNSVLEESFNGGMCTDNIPLAEGQYKHIVNFMPSESGNQLIPRKGLHEDNGIVNSQELSTDELLESAPTNISTTLVGTISYKFPVNPSYKYAENTTWLDNEELEDNTKRLIVASANTKYEDRKETVFQSYTNELFDGTKLDSYYTAYDALAMYTADSNNINQVTAMAGFTKVGAQGTTNIYYQKPSVNVNVVPNFAKSTPYYIKTISGPYSDNVTRTPGITVFSNMDKFRPLPRIVGDILDNTLCTTYTNKILTTDTNNPLVRKDYFCTFNLSTVGENKIFSRKVEPENINPAYATNYGYNMLSDTPYTFKCESGAAWELMGMLPYTDSSCTEVCFDYKTNQRVYFKLYYYYPSTNNTNSVSISYKLLGEDDYKHKITGVGSLPISSDGIVIPFTIPAEGFIFHIEITNTSNNIVATAGDFSFSGGAETVDEYGSTKNLGFINYDLTTAIGMLSWKHRLVVWGVDKAPNILFTSDDYKPSYFPYPNRCEMYDECILHVCVFMDALLVFTPNTIYKTELDDKGILTTTTVVTDVNLVYDDIYSIVPVKNMLFYKSNNYYYMLVPSSKALTFGEFKVAPVSTPINYLLDHFDDELKDILINMYSEELKYPEREDLTLIPSVYHTYLCDNEVRINYGFDVKYKVKVANTVGTETLPITFVLKYNTVSRNWYADLYINDNVIQLYIKNVAGTPKFITYTHEQYATAGDELYRWRYIKDNSDSYGLDIDTNYILEDLSDEFFQDETEHYNTGLNSETGYNYRPNSNSSDKAMIERYKPKMHFMYNCEAYDVASIETGTEFDIAGGISTPIMVDASFLDSPERAVLDNLNFYSEEKEWTWNNDSYSNSINLYDVYNSSFVPNDSSDYNTQFVSHAIQLVKKLDGFRTDINPDYDLSEMNADNFRIYGLDESHEATLSKATHVYICKVPNKYKYYIGCIFIGIPSNNFKNITVIDPIKTNRTDFPSANTIVYNELMKDNICNALSARCPNVNVSSDKARVICCTSQIESGKYYLRTQHNELIWNENQTLELADYVGIGLFNKYIDYNRDTMESGILLSLASSVTSDGVIALIDRSVGEPLCYCDADKIANTATPQFKIKIIPHILTETIDDTQDKSLTKFYSQFKTKHYIDTGYRSFNASNKKRMREIQFKINNKLTVPLTFKTGFAIDNVQRVRQGSYTLQPNDSGSSVIVVPTAKQSTIGATYFEDDNGVVSTNENVFALSNSDLGMTNTATIRWKVSGKGYLPRLTLLSENEKSFEIHGISWVARTMNMR